MSSAMDNATVVVGSGPAGLTAALALARYRHPVVLVDGGRPSRNGMSSGVHGHVGLDGLPPAEIHARAWRELARYPAVDLRTADAVSVGTAGTGRFRVVLDDGETLESTTVLLATGVVDVLPDLDGFSACWGRTVIHCPFCLGEENAGGRWAVVTDNPQLATLSAVGFRAWAKDTVAICPDSMPGLDQARSAARELGGDVVAGTVGRLLHRDGALYAVEFTDGRVLERETLVWTPAQRQPGVVARAVAELNLATDNGGFLTVDDNQCTDVPGLYAAGDVASRWKQSFTAAAAAGATAADAIHAAAILGAAHF